MKNIPWCWANLAEMIDNTYGTQFTPDDEAGEWDFICPECGEPILEKDWTFREVKYCCPICEYEWEF